MADCPICTEPFTEATRKVVKCPYCQYDCCTKCLKTYILSNVSNPNCMNCHVEFNREFLDMHLTANFRTKEYKPHRENILFEREKSMLTATMPFVEREMDKRRMYANVKVLQERKAEIMRGVAEIEQQISQLYRNWHNEGGDLPPHLLGADAQIERRQFIKACVMEGCRGFLSTQWKCGVCDTRVCRECHEPKTDENDEAHVCKPENVESAKLIAKETKPCPKCASAILKVSGCFARDTVIPMWDGTFKMSQNIKSGDFVIGDDGTKRVVQDTCTGTDMMYEVSQNDGLTYVVNSKHTMVFKQIITLQDIEMTIDSYMQLDDNTKLKLYGYKSLCVGSIILTKLTIKPIGVSEYFGWRLDGNKRFILQDFTVVRNCSQMWCTQCHTTFDWNTGREIVTTNVHNPHYFEWVRRNNNGVVPRNPGDNPCGVPGQLPQYTRFHARINRWREDLEIIKNVDNLYMAIRHMNDYNIVREAPNVDASAANRDLRIKYLMNNLEEADMKKELQVREKTTDFAKAKSQVCEMLLHVGIELFNALMEAEDIASAERICDQIKAIVEHYNEAMQKVHKRFNSKAKGLLLKEKWGLYN